MLPPAGETSSDPAWKFKQDRSSKAYDSTDPPPIGIPVSHPDTTLHLEIITGGMESRGGWNLYTKYIQNIYNIYKMAA